jgi:predicted ribosome quality control (RQC) complex YloA/Tae2 family protein
MFRDGNLILCQEDGMIIQPLTHATYADRTLKKGHIYAPPPASKDPHELTVKDISQILANSEKNLVATLGSKEVLGGSLAKAVIADCKFDDKAAPQDVAAAPIHHSLTKILTSTEDGGYAHLKSTTELDLAIPSVDRDAFIEKNCNAVWPIEMPLALGENVFRFATFSAAIDAWKGGPDSAALARREEELLDVAAPGRGHSTAVERLERRLAQQEKALSGFDLKGEGQQSLGHMIQNEWVHVDNLLNQANQAIAEQGFAAVGKMVKSIEWIASIDASKRSMQAFLPDENGNPDTKVTLYLDDSVHQNASRYFTVGRKQKNKIREHEKYEEL